MSPSPDLGLLRLAHVALSSPDPERLATWYERNVGLVRVESPDGPVRLTTDGHPHCLELHEGESGLRHVAFEVRDLTVARDRLAERGTIEPQSTEAAGWTEALRFNDHEGNEIRLVAGGRPTTTVHPGSRTFRPRKIGHVGVKASDLHGLVAFYTDELGFRLSDWIGEQVVFLRCNPDHHAIVFVSQPRERPDVHHVAYEVPSFEGFADQADMLAGNGVSVGWGPGRHAPSRNYFMYFDDVDGNRIEWMAGVRLIYDEAGHVPQVFDPAIPTSWNVWGPLPPPEFLTGIGPAAAA
jgi:catechol-2,3-dioxygenase